MSCSLILFEMEEFETSNLTKEQVLKAFEKIDPLLCEEHSEESLLLARIAVLEEEQQLSRTQIETLKYTYSTELQTLTAALAAANSALSTYEGDPVALSQLSHAELTRLEGSLLSSLALISALKHSKLQALIQQGIQDSQLCVACRERSLNTLLRPCNHISLCTFCALHVEKCPLCRCVIISHETVYLSMS